MAERYQQFQEAESFAGLCDQSDKVFATKAGDHVF